MSGVWTETLVAGAPTRLRRAIPKAEPASASWAPRLPGGASFRYVAFVDETDHLREAVSSRVLHAGLLAAPFAIVVLASAGLTHPFHVYQDFDEAVHFSIVRSVAASWPRPLLSGYPSWSGPFVYWLLASLSRPFGGSLVACRLAVTVLSWSTCVTAYVIFRDRLGATPRTALALAALLATSPFFFGESFRVLTDNPAWLFVALALERLLAYVQRPRTGALAGYAVCSALAMLTRQLTAWLVLPALVVLLMSRAPSRERARSAAIMACGLLPLVALFVVWGGLLPSGGASTGPSGYGLRNIVLALAVVGLWGILLVPADDVAALPARLTRTAWATVAGSAVVTLAVIAAGALSSLRGGDPYGLGLIGRLGQAWWRVDGTSGVWWVLAPLGASMLVTLVATRFREDRDRVLVVALAALVLTSAASATWYQRYVDFGVLLCLCGLVAGGATRLREIDVLRWVGVVAISAVWAFTTARP